MKEDRIECDHTVTDKMTQGQVAGLQRSIQDKLGPSKWYRAAFARVKDVDNESKTRDPAAIRLIEQRQHTSLAWLRSVPTCPSNTLSNAAVTTGLRAILGMPLIAEKDAPHKCQGCNTSFSYLARLSGLDFILVIPN